jgi:hypothetical protein
MMAVVIGVDDVAQPQKAIKSSRVYEMYQLSRVVAWELPKYPGSWGRLQGSGSTVVEAVTSYRCWSERGWQNANCYGLLRLRMTGFTATALPGLGASSSGSLAMYQVSLFSHWSSRSESR